MPLLHRHLPSLLRASSPLPTTSLSALHRLLSTTTASTSPSPNRFAVDDYLVTSCHLTPSQALRASKRLSHLKSNQTPSSPSRRPRLLRRGHRHRLRRRPAPPLRQGRQNPNPPRRRAPRPGLLSSPDRPPHPARSLSLPQPPILAPFLWLLRRLAPSPSRLLHLSSGARNEPQASHGCRGARRRVRRVAWLETRMGFLKTLGCSQADVTRAVSKSPKIVWLSEEKLRRGVEFLTGGVGLEAQYIARRPQLLNFSLEGRLVPWHCVLKVLKSKGLLGTDRDFRVVAEMPVEKFLDKFLSPYAESVPGLTDAYASACAGKVPAGVAL